MARGSGRTIPSILGGGLERGTRAILDAVLERERRELQERQITAAERNQAINQLTTLAGLVRPGTTLNDLGDSVMDLFGRALDIDPSGLGDLELSPRTIQTALEEKGLELIDEDAFPTLEAIRAAAGLTPSEVVAGAEESEARLRSFTIGQILSNPEFAREAVERQLGRTPIDLRIPGIGDQPDQIIPFDSETAARLYAGFLQAREEFGFRLRLDQDDPIQMLIEETQKAVRDHPQGQSISTPAVRRVFRVYNDAIAQGAPEKIQEFLESNVTQGEKLAMEFLVGSIQAGEQAFINELRELSPDLAFFYNMAQLTREAFGVEDAQEIMELAGQALGPGVGGRLVDPFGPRMLGRGPRIEVTPREGAGGDAPPGGGSLMGFVDPALLEEGAFNLLRQGIPRQALVRDLGAEAVEAAEARIAAGDTGQGRVSISPDEAARLVHEGQQADVPEGGIDPSTVPQELLPDVQRLNTFLERRARMSEGADTRALDSVISRLRRSVEERIAFEAVEIPRTVEGLVDLDEIPPAARDFALRLNTVIRTRERATGSVAQQGLDSQIRLLERRIKNILAGN